MDQSNSMNLRWMSAFAVSRSRTAARRTLFLPVRTERLVRTRTVQRTSSQHPKTKAERGMVLSAQISRLFVLYLPCN